MPKDRRVNSPSFDRAMVSPYSCSSKLPDHKNNSSFAHAGDEKEWEEARCPICMEHPHNAVLLLCSSRKKGCRPFICDTSYRHSNCLDQFRKSAAASSLSFEREKCELVCPLCRGPVTGWDVIQPAREFMNSKARSCSLETCEFIGKYGDLRKHARLEHPCKRPSEASPTRQSNWTVLEQQREMEDALAHQSDIEYDFDAWPSWDDWGGDDDFWSDGSFFDFPSGMSDIDDDMFDEMFSGLSLSLFSLYPSSPDEDMMDSGSSRSSDRPQRAVLSTDSSSRLNDHAGNISHNPRPRTSHHSEDGATVSRSRTSNRRGNHNGSNNFRSRSGYRGESGPTRPSHPRENVSSVSRSRSSYHLRDNGPASSRTRTSYAEDGWPSSRTGARSRTRLYPRDPGPLPARRLNSRRPQGSARPPQSGYGRRGE